MIFETNNYDYNLLIHLKEDWLKNNTGYVVGASFKEDLAFFIF